MIQPQRRLETLSPELIVVLLSTSSCPRLRLQDLSRAMIYRKHRASRKGKCYHVNMNQSRLDLDSAIDR